MDSPFLKILVEGNDISEFVETFEYEDSIDKDNLVKIRIKPEYAAEILEESYFQVNSSMKFKFGYITKQESATHKAKISDIETSYGRQGINVTFSALDLGNVIKKTSEKVVWKNKTGYQIAKDIAKKYGFEFFGDPTKKVYSNYPQANMSDFELLKKLADLEYDYIFYLRNNELHFEKRALDSKADLLLTWGKDDFVSFKPSQKLSKSDGTNVTTGVDGVEATKEDLDSNLNKRQYTYDVNAENETKVDVKKNTVTITEDDEEAENVAKSQTRDSELKVNESTIEIVGNPTVKSKMIVTISNVASRYRGNWQIKTVRHMINQSGYTTSMELGTDGTNFKSDKTKDAANGNTSVGEDNVDETKTVYEYDVDGNRK